MHDIQDFVDKYEPYDLSELPNGPMQWGAKVQQADGNNIDWDNIDIVLVGCETDPNNPIGADLIRQEFYQTYCWHDEVQIADIGNIKRGETYQDTMAALVAVLEEIANAGKIAVLLGSNHQLTFQQYDVFRKKEQSITCTVADMYVDIDDSEELSDRNFLMDMLTTTPNFVKHFSHLAFQNYYGQPRILETLDKLRFDFFRLGNVQADIEAVEPVLRATDLFSFDIAAVKYPDAIMNVNGSPNGLSGVEACTLARYAGMSEKLMSFGIYGYSARMDRHRMTARLIGQMLWYFVDGLAIRKSEAPTDNLAEFTKFSLNFEGYDCTFIKSKRTGRWWMKMPDGYYIPCSYRDYLMACDHQIPERWLREHERLV